MSFQDPVSQDSMTTDRHACGLGSFLPMSCRGRAEAFARRLQSRLQSLGRTSSGDPGETEESWITSQPHFPTSHQPRHSTSSDSDIYFDFDVDFDSPGSPQEEATDDLHDILLNKPRGAHGETQRECKCIPENQEAESGCATASATAASPGSDDSSDNNFYDPGESFDFSPAAVAASCVKSLPFTEDLSELIDSTLKESSSHVQCNGFQNDGGNEEDACLDCSTLSTTDNNNVIEEDKADTSCDVNGLAESQSDESKNPTTFKLEEHETTNETNNAPIHVNGQSEGADDVDNVRLEQPATRVRRPRIDYATRLHNGQRHHEEAVVTCPPVYTSEVVIPGPESFCSALTLAPHEMVIDCPGVEVAANLVSDEQAAEVGGETKQKEVADEVETATSTVLKITVETVVGTKIKVDDDEEDDERPQRVRRCSSLKTGKTPPGTPGRKKIVRFADVLGLDLADVRTFLDEIPKVPTSAYEDLQDADLSLGSTSSINSLAAAIGCTLPKPDKTLVPLFVQPGGCTDFFDRIREQQVCLENAIVTDVMTATIAGTVRVRNLDFNKSVHIRYSLDCWKTFSDLQASYIQNSCDGFSDTFSFVLYAHTLTIGQRIEFAVRFQCHGCQYWDSNRGTNYAFQCLPAGPMPYRSQIMTTCPDEQWASFY